MLTTGFNEIVLPANSKLCNFQEQIQELESLAVL